MPLDRSVAEILKEPDRSWTPEPAADDNEIAYLRKVAPIELPHEYVELLRYCNGGEGPLDAQPLWFQLYAVATAIEYNAMWRSEGQYLKFWFIGGNGGGESIAFDLRSGPPWPLVMIDFIAGEESAQKIADDMADLIMRIGLEPEHLKWHGRQFTGPDPESIPPSRPVKPLPPDDGAVLAREQFWDRVRSAQARRHGGPARS